MPLPWPYASSTLLSCRESPFGVQQETMPLSQPLSFAFGPGRSPADARRRTLLLSALAPLLGAVGACTTEQPLVLAGHPWPGYEPFFLARALGLQPEGVRLHETATALETIATMRRGEADGAMLTLNEVLQLRDEGIDLEIVLVFDVSRGADMLLAHPRIRTLAALKGQRLGVEQGSLGAVMLSLALEKAGLRPQDVIVRQTAYEQQESAWLNKEVDALITYEPVAGRLLRQGARQLLSTRHLPDTIFDVLAVERSAAIRHEDHLRASLIAYFQALDYLRQNPWDAAYRQAPRLKVSAQEMIDSLRGLQLPDLLSNQRYLGAGNSPLLQAAQRFSPILQDAGLIKHPVQTGNLITSAYLPRS